MTLLVFYSDCDTSDKHCRTCSCGHSRFAYSLCFCDFVLKSARVKLACVVERAADDQGNERELGPPMKPKKRCKCHGAKSKNKMHAHVNCFLGEIRINTELSFGAEEVPEWLFGDPAGVWKLQVLKRVM
jgi:hypothetical protein